MHNLTRRLRDIAASEGIDVIKFVSAEPFENYLLAESPRRDPHLTLADAQTLIVCLVDIGGIDVPDSHDPSTGLFSRLILSGFYFDVVDPLQKIAAELVTEGYQAVICDGFKDRSVLPLKLAAVRAGLGWQGKNSLLITKEYGSFLALGGIITNAPLVHDPGEKVKDGCGSCEACRKACPMGALDEPYRLNIDKCLSNLLEVSGPLPPEVKEKMGNMVLECDLCQSICPWNKKAAQSGRKRKNHSSSIADIHQFFKLSHLMQLSPEDYNKYLGYRLTGVDYKTFRRNVAAAMENAGQK